MKKWFEAWDWRGLVCVSYCSWGSQGKNTEVVCHSLLQWTTFCQISPPWTAHLGLPHTAWLSFIELDKAVVRVIRLTSFLWLWFQCICPLMPSRNTYHLTWVSFILDEGYLFRLLQQNAAAAPYLGRGVFPYTPPDLGCGVAPLGPPAPTVSQHSTDFSLQHPEISATSDTLNLLQ